MSAGSAWLPTERREGDGGTPSLERLIGIRSSKPSFYAAWREKSARLDRTIETLERISTALCATPDGPGALCEAVVEAAGHHFNARWAAIAFSQGVDAHELPPVIARADGRTVPLLADLPPGFSPLADQALAARGPVVLDASPDLALPGQTEDDGAVAVPMPLRGELAGVLAVGLTAGAEVQTSDLSILVTLANHAGVALHNAWSFQESEQLRLRSEAVSRIAERRAAELERRSRELEGTRRRLEQAGRQQLLSQERNRIARELHDSVAQQLLTIGMNLEWCRRQEGITGPVFERVTASKALAGSAVDEIRAAIFELARDGQIELRRALREVIADVQAGTRLDVALRSTGRQRALPPGVQHAIVQIVREALFNVVRHALASRAGVTLQWQPSRLTLTVGDDGCGDQRHLQHLLLAPRPSGQHLGLTGIGERVRGLGGTAEFRRRRGGGVNLRVEIPVGGSFDCD
jgi:signal transduction histidine kinase